MKNLSTVERAKELRKELKKAFPNTKFSVRSNSFSMGSSITVSWTDFPSKEAVEDIAWKYRSVRTCEVTGEVLNGGNTYLHLNNSWSDEMKATIKEELINKYGVEFYNEHIEDTYDSYRYENEMYKNLYEASLVVAEVEEVAEVTEATEGKKEIFSNEEMQILEVGKTTRVYFNGKPSEEIRNGLKALGFRFFKNDGFYWGNYSSKVDLEALKTALQIEEAAEAETATKENNNSLSEAEAIEILLHTEEYKNQVLKEEIEEVEKEIQPIEFKEVEENNIIYLNNVEIARKPSDISDIKEFSELENILIDKYAILSNEDFDFMCKNLMNDYNFISGLGGTRAEAKEGEEVQENYDINYIYENRNKFNFYEVNILITNEDKNKFIVVNPHGHSYCRYTGVLTASEGQRVLKQLTEGKANKLQLIETENANTDINNDNISNIEKCEILHSEIEALENRLKMVNSQKLKYKIQEQINDKTKEMAIIIYNDKNLYNDFLKYQK